ncbi:MAG: hypothetical protein HS115_00355 [Spirochaetales bacterium]|nr:hypothetical protein [Spirochaetales bacterium]
MDKELAFYLKITRRLPNVPRISALVNRIIKPLYLRKPRSVVVTEVDGLKLELNPSEAVDGALLFYPQLYDRAEIEFLRSHLKKDSIFLDLGAYIGYYAMQAARVISGGGGACPCGGSGA